MTVRNIFIAVITLVLSFSAYGSTLSNEALTYKVMFKWGLINKQAGHGTLYLRDEGNRYVSTLYAQSEPWADKFYKVRDTLSTIMSKPDMLPTKYERIAHEGGKYSHDIVNFTKKALQCPETAIVTAGTKTILKPLMSISHYKLMVQPWIWSAPSTICEH